MLTFIKGSELILTLLMITNMVLMSKSRTVKNFEKNEAVHVSVQILANISSSGIS